MVPFGKQVTPVPGIEYIVANGKQECQICQSIIAESYTMGAQYVDLCGFHTRDNVNVPLCRAQVTTPPV